MFVFLTGRELVQKSFKPFAKGVGGYMNSTLAKIDAVKEGFDDAVAIAA